MFCPICKKSASDEHRLLTHMKGKPPAGHGLTEGEALARIHGPRLPSSPTPIRHAAPIRRAPVVIGAGAPQPTVVLEPPPPTSVSGDFLRDLFATLVRNKALPKYQLERRVDAMLSLFLPAILRARLGWNVDVVVPEFPLKRPDNNQTTNVDYALFRRGDARHPPAWIFIEIKTDGGSLRDAQLDTYLAAQARGMPSLIADLHLVLAATTHRAKYQELIQAVSRYPEDAALEVLFLVPRDAAGQLRGRGVHVVAYDELRSLELDVYQEAWSLFRSTMLPALS